MLGKGCGHLASASQLNLGYCGARGDASPGRILPIPPIDQKSRANTPLRPFPIFYPRCLPKYNVLSPRRCRTRFHERERAHKRTERQTKKQAIRVQQRNGSSRKSDERNGFGDTLNRNPVYPTSEGALGPRCYLDI